MASCPLSVSPLKKPIAVIWARRGRECPVQRYKTRDVPRVESAVSNFVGRRASRRPGETGPWILDGPSLVWVYGIGIDLASLGYQAKREIAQRSSGSGMATRHRPRWSPCGLILAICVLSRHSVPFDVSVNCVHVNGQLIGFEFPDAIGEFWPKAFSHNAPTFEQSWRNSTLPLYRLSDGPNHPD